MRRWIGLAIAGGVLCFAPVLLRNVLGAQVDPSSVLSPSSEEGDELAKAKSAQGFVKPVTPPPLTDLRLTELSMDEDAATAPAFGGRTAKLTLEPALQKLADRILGSSGAEEATIVMTDAKTGRVLVYASYVAKGPKRDLAVEASAPAASVFKIITGSALVEHAQLGPDTRQCYWGGEHRVDAQNLIEDPKKDKYCATMAEAMGRSLNTVFARLSQKHLDQTKLGATARSLGFGEPMSFDVPVQANTITLPDDSLGFARTSAGFWNTTLSPLGGAALAMAMANRGQVIRPYVVESISDDKGMIFKAPQRHVLGRAIRPETADAVTRMMESTVSDGTGYKAFHDQSGRPYLPNITVASKTGTLTKQTSDQFYTWFVGFAPSRDPQVAFSVLIVNKSTWKVKANTVGREMLQGYFAARGAPGVQKPVL
jgi:penicillin-binding protein A